MTPAEAAVVRSLLACEDLPERDRIRGSGIPPRTFTDVRGRVLSEGWIVDRYLPQPGLLELPFVTLILAEPFVEHASAVLETWSADPRIVLLWTSPQGLLAVRLGSSPKPSLPGIRDVSDGRALRRQFALTLDTRAAQLPIYFDFEAAWSRAVGLQGSLAYPHGWTSVPREPGATAPRLPSAPARVSVAGLVNRPFEVESSGRPPNLNAPFFLPRSQVRALEQGWVHRRVFLDPVHLSALQAPRIENLVFIHGRMLRGSLPDRLLEELVTRCLVTPYLYASDGTSLILGAVSPLPPSTVSSSAPRTSVSATLGNYLEGIEVTRVPLTSLRAPVNHRYDRLVRS
ncbi:MAG: hypothetical protein KGJ23_15310 [Euryarchaeota archaeon]|nr:hypothetical protein [Euryarchaeota archaeon]MDE1837968.1 hypothetical protein [Euryarchaeota archaeon]MDE1880158.1 hypothetical protein [Euryarchaeota archaeon]MDE2046406.1 hypothetical protein [Thermoplasmata archaeon]